MTAFTRGSNQIPMKFSARRSSSARVKRRSVVISGSRRTVYPARSSALTPRVSQPTRGEYEGATTPMVSPFVIGAGRNSGSEGTEAISVAAGGAVAASGRTNWSEASGVIAGQDNNPRGPIAATTHVRPLNCSYAVVATAPRLVHVLPEGFRPKGRGPGGSRRLSRGARRSHEGKRLHADGGGHHHPLGQGVRVLLRRGARGGVRLPDAPEVPGTADRSRRRDHPQPVRQRAVERPGNR